LTVSETSSDAPFELPQGYGAPSLQKIVRDGVEMRGATRTTTWPESHVMLVREGTSITMTSGQLDVDALARLAVSLLPAPGEPPPV
jgi:hypothetical protein